MNVIEPLQFSFVVNCAPAHAFEVWTSKASMWWPPSHTVTGAEGLQVIFEEGRGGRIFERTQAGEEVDWGEIKFVDQGDGTTLVKIEHGGWERLGDRGPRWRDVNRGGWERVIPPFQEAARANSSAC